MKHNINPLLLKSVPKTPETKEDLKVTAIKNWSFGKKKGFGDYIKDESIDRNLRETVYYWFYAAYIICKEGAGDPSYKNVIDHLNYCFGYIMYGFEKEKYDVIERVLNTDFSKKVIELGKKWAKQDHREFYY